MALRISEYDGVVRFDLARGFAGRGYYWTTAYYVDGLLIDTGCAHTVSEIVQAMQSNPLSLIVNTHSHEDHIGANAAFQKQRKGIIIYAHARAVPVLADPRRLLGLHLYQRLMWGWPQPSEAHPLEDGDTVETDRFRFQVIYTPGHTDDHICLYEPNEGWIFSGDLFVGGRDRVLRREYNIWQIIESLKKIARLPARWLFPASARVRQNPQEVLQSKIAYLEELGNRVLELHGKGWEVDAIAEAVCGRRLPIELITRGHFSRRNLVLSYLRDRPQAE